MSIARKSALDFASRVGVLVITLLTGIALNRMLGREGRGAYVLATAIAFTQLQNLFSFGIQVSNQVFSGKDRGLLGSLHAWSVVLSVCVGVVSGLGVWVFWEVLTGTVFGGIAPLHLVAVAVAVGPAFYWMAWQGLMVGTGDIAGLAGFNVGMAVVQNGAIVVCLAVLRPMGDAGRMAFCVTLLIWVYVVLLWLSLGWMAWRLGRQGRLWGRLEGGLLGRLLSFGGRVYLGNFASGLLAQLDQILVNGLAGIGALGVYQQASSLASKVWMIPAGIENASYGPVSGSGRVEARGLTADLFRVTLYVSFGICLAGWAASPVIPLLYGEEFRATVYPFRVLLLGAAAFGCGRMFSMYFTGQRQRPQVLVVLNVLLLPFHACACLWLIPGWGLAGACWATTLTYTLSAGALFVLFARDGEWPGWRRFFVPGRSDVDRLVRLWRWVRGG